MGGSCGLRLAGYEVRRLWRFGQATSIDER
jgi:hypothetical protein